MSDEEGEPEELESLPERDQSPSELRRLQEQVREFRRVFNDQARSRNTAHGGDAFGGDKVTGDKYIYMAKGKDSWQLYPVPPERLDDIRLRFAGTASKETLIHRLDNEPVAVLQGLPGTGRTTTALAALAHRCRELRMIRSTEPPIRLDKGKLSPGHGYLYNVSGQSWAKRLTEGDVLGCWDTLKELDARMVIVVGPDSDKSEVSELVTDHQRPDPRDVLARQLSQRLAGVPHDLTEILGRIPEAPTSPRDAKDLAVRLASALRSGGSVEDVCTDRPDPWRHEARAVLHQEDDQSDLGRRAFVIAGAVLNEQPTVQVCRAAYDLAGRLFEVEKQKEDAKLGMLPFAAMLDDWLQHAREQLSPIVQDLDRRLSFRAKFAPAVLDALWLDYVVAHQTLLDWLSQLARDNDPLVRLKAAQTVGRFAAYDFDFVYEHCIAGWVASRREALHMAAAWALEAVIAECPQRHDRVAGLLRMWLQQARPEGIARQSTAVRLLGTLLGEQAAGQAMEALRSIARRHPHVLKLAVRDTVVELCASGSTRVVLSHLRGWARSEPRELGGLVAACLTKIAQLTNGERPRILALHEEDPVLVRELWCQVLLSRYCGQDPWNALRDWAKDGIRFDALRDDLYAEPGLRPRMRFYGLL
ncbi:hypothetical protein ACQPZP_28105 [Spirillospora sp. CA-142024]|uniref:hypothetical protein n=1 Tax=Spirillospora sp. CA-142024 TaxID=3240036 RepID=UPI003D8D3A46